MNPTLSAVLLTILLISKLRAGSTDLLTYETSADSVTITGFSWSHYGPVVVPQTIEGKPVTAIADYACRSREGITSVTLPASVKQIGRSAFEDCFDLSTIHLPDSILDIGDLAFRDCDNLRSVTLPSKLNHLGASAFESCDKLKEIKLPSSLAVISPFLFFNCHSLSACDIPIGVISIGESAFSGTALRDAILPAGLNSIGKSAFSGCRNLSNAQLSESVTKIPDKLFYYCGSLTHIKLPRGLRAIGASAFEGSSLTEIDLKNVVSIGSHAFANCNNMRRIGFPASVRFIGDRAFASSPLLTTANFEGNAPQMGERVFGRTPADFRIYVEESSSGFTIPRWLGYKLTKPRAEILVQNADGESLQYGSIDPIRFGSVPVGTESRSEAFLITNMGNRPLIDIESAIHGEGFLEFTINKSAARTLAPGESTTLKVTFQPLVRGKRTVSLFLGSSDSDETMFSIPLSGIGIEEL